MPLVHWEVPGGESARVPSVEVKEKSQKSPAGAGLVDAPRLVTGDF